MSFFLRPRHVMREYDLAPVSRRLGDWTLHYVFPCHEQHAVIILRIMCLLRVSISPEEFECEEWLGPRNAR